jgi:hypothetical protein
VRLEKRWRILSLDSSVFTISDVCSPLDLSNPQKRQLTRAHFESTMAIFSQDWHLWRYEPLSQASWTPSFSIVSGLTVIRAIRKCSEAESANKPSTPRGHCSHLHCNKLEYYHMCAKHKFITMYSLPINGHRKSMGLSFKTFSQGDAEFYLMSFSKVVDQRDEIYCARGLAWNELVR